MGFRYVPLQNAPEAFAPLIRKAIMKAMSLSARPKPAGEKRLRFLECLRGICALYVVCGHLISMVDPARLIGQVDRSPAWLCVMATALDYGHLAVAAFIVISGFSLHSLCLTTEMGPLPASNPTLFGEPNEFCLLITRA